MSQTISRISPVQAGKLFGVMYLILGALFMPFFLLPAVFSEQSSPFGLGFAIALPFLYGVMGFLGTAFFCWLYNVLARRLGGIEITLSPSSTGSEST